MNPVRAERLNALPPYLFVEIDRRKNEAVAAGRDVINLGVGDPDLPTPPFIVERMQAEVARSANHTYPPGIGIPELRTAIADWFAQRFGVALDPAREVLVLIGSKEGLGHLPLAVVNPGQTVLVPQPGYPVYTSASIFAGAKVVPMTLSRAARWLPDFDAIPRDVRQAARLMFLCYPNNPTAATADLAFYERAVAFAREYGILIAQDAAYSETYFDARPPSIMQVPGAKEIAVEFHSLSKTFSMTGWRIAFAVGNADILAALAAVKSNVDSGQFAAIQLAAVEAMRGIDRIEVRAQLDIYRERRDVFCAGLRALGYDIDTPPATFYAWLPCPRGCDSMTFATKVLEEASVVLIPGVGFGAAGEGYVRAALTRDVSRIREAVERIGRLKL